MYVKLVSDIELYAEN